MVITPRYIYLATPRSASRTVTKALQDLGAVHEKPHHASLEVVEAAKLHHNLPTITLLRDPAHILLSFWWVLQAKNVSFSEYITTGFYGIFAPTLSALNGRKHPRRIYPYHSVTDEYFPYAEGIPAFLVYLGYEDPFPFVSFGVREKRPDAGYITTKHRALIQKYFPEDVRIYDAL